MGAYADLLGFQKQTQALGLTAGLLSWDQEVMMPAKGAAQRAEQAGVLEAVLHARRTDPRIGDWLAAAGGSDLPPEGAANLRLIRRSYDRALRVPADLAEARARVTTEAQMTWAKAREASDFAAFRPTLEQVIALTRDYAAAVRQDGESLYDALLQDFEPGATEAGVSEIFARLRAGITDLRARILAKGAEVPHLSGIYGPEPQMALARELARAFGYDFEAGRLDLSVHPFTNGTRGDSRITTRVAAENPFDCLYSTIHEVGHALYEQGLDPDLEWQPAGQSVSMGVHESQSRFCENQIGRSAAYAEYLFPLLTRQFGAIGVETPRDLYRALNRVAPGFIRTEADEIHYNLHIMLRFDLERAMISGDLQPADLPGAWNDRFAADFGVAVTDDADGVLQDVHWSCGLFGYFPTYTLGNIYAGCLTEALRRDVPDMDLQIRSGKLEPMTGWMRNHVHRRGSLVEPQDIVATAVGAPPDERPLLAYLEAKFADLYDL